MSFPLTMTGHDRTYTPPRALRPSLGTAVTAWDLLALESDPDAASWAQATLAALVAAVDQEAMDALGCTDCTDTGFYGVADPDNQDLLTGLVRRTATGSHQAMQTQGSWDDWDPKSCPLEVLSLDLAGDLAAAITGGACGLLRRYGYPRAWLPPTSVVAASPLSLLLSADGEVTPQGEWVNLAVVDEVDQGAVFDLVRVRAGQAEVWEMGDWTPDEDLLLKADLPMVRLDDVQLAEVQSQIQSLTASGLTAASLDPRAARLRLYWTAGKGAAKIRWGTPSDWKRCYRHLSKYMGLRAKGYCQLLHRQTTGVYTGSRFNVGGNGHHHRLGSAVGIDSPALVQVAGAAHPRPFGSVHHIFRSGDVVKFVPAEPGAAPLASAILSMGDRFEVGGVNVPPVIASPVAGTVGVEVVKHVVEFVPIGNGADIDKPRRSMSNSITESPGTVAVPIAVEGSSPPPGAIRQDVVVRLEFAHDEPRCAGFHDSGVMLAAEPPLQASGHTVSVIDATSHGFYCTHATCGWRAPSPEETLLASMRARRSTERNTDMPELHLVDGEYTAADPDNEALFSALTAGAIPVAPPDEWFDDPKLDRPTTLTIEDTGRVFGHLAPWDVTHIGMAGEVPPPPNPDGQYRYYRTGNLVTASGATVRVGQLTLAGGHAPTRGRRLSTEEVIKHYDDTASGVADVTAGEDEHGIWVAGALRPTVTPEQIRVMRATPPSGDWRAINGKLELVAACHVNVQGFPIAAALTAGGAEVALVAAGARTMAVMMAAQRADKAVLARLDQLEQLIASAAVAEAPVEAAPEPEATDNPAAAATTEIEEPSSNGTASEAPEEEVQLTEAELAKADKIARAREMAAGIRKDQLRARRAAATTAGALPPQFAANAKKKADDAEDKKDGGKDEAEEGDPAKEYVPGTKSYPIDKDPKKGVADIKNAVQAIGRAKDPEATKKHIKKMAFRHKRPDLIPPNWKK